MSEYRAGDAGADLCRDAPASVAAKWAAMADGLAALSHDGPGARDTIHEQVARQIQDLGLTFRVAGDADERAWPLTPMPLIIGADEWAKVEAGLIQRATLLEAIAADIYGPQTLVGQGHLPAAVIAGSRFFARAMVGLKPQGGDYLQVCAFDLARGPDGQWRILADRLRLATGIGYALENRLALSRSTGTLLGTINTRRIADFFAALRGGIARNCPRERPRIALLTPGRFNQSYPEQAHLARYLGLPLVEGRDLIVTAERLYVRTIAGPRRIDALWRWIDTNALDPLSFDSRSAIGVPDLFEAWAHGGLEMTNWPGVEVLEERAFAAFMPRLSKILLGQALALPNVATWWCGQPGEAAHVLARLDDLLVGPAFGQAAEALNPGAMQPGAGMTAAQRGALAGAITRRPMDYCGQEIIHLSTSPVLIGDRLAARPFTLRAFVTRDGNGAWTVMAGGFARLSSSGKLLTSLMGEGDLSADVCIVDDNDATPLPAVAAWNSDLAVRRDGGILASQAADNLYWFGRYCERAEATLRIVRSILGSAIEADAGAVRDARLRRFLAQLLATWGAIPEKDIDGSLVRICSDALATHGAPGGVATLIRNLQRVGLSLRDRLARDFWRIARRAPPPLDIADLERNGPEAVRDAVKILLERFGALSGLIAENMVRDDAFRFLEMGRRIERALLTCRIAQHLAASPDQADALSLLLDLCDSQIIYRSRYLSGPVRDPVYDLVLLDPDNPRSLIFQLIELHRHLAALPTLADDGMPEAPLRAARALLGPLESMTVDRLDDAALTQIEADLLDLSDAISARYFLPMERVDTPVPGDLLI